MFLKNIETRRAEQLLNDYSWSWMGPSRMFLFKEASTIQDGITAASLIDKWVGGWIIDPGSSCQHESRRYSVQRFLSSISQFH